MGKEQGTETKALATVASYAVLQADQGALGEMLATNVGPGGLSVFDLDTVKTPAGGGTTFTVPSVDGEEEAKELRGVLVGFKDMRSYWRTGFDESGGGTPPDCSSQDMVHGEGDPGGECARCPYSKFGTAGRAQACQQRRLLFLVREGDLLPIVVSVSPASLKPVRQFFLRLASHGVPYYGVLASLTLAKDKNRDGIAYSKITIAMAGRLSSEEAARMRSYSEALRPAIERVQLQDSAAA